MEQLLSERAKDNWWTSGALPRRGRERVAGNTECVDDTESSVDTWRYLWCQRRRRTNVKWGAGSRTPQRAEELRLWSSVQVKRSKSMIRNSPKINPIKRLSLNFQRGFPTTARKHQPRSSPPTQTGTGWPKDDWRKHFLDLNKEIFICFYLSCYLSVSIVLAWVAKNQYLIELDVSVSCWNYFLPAELHPPTGSPAN